jgi:hypothetical protein
MKGPIDAFIADVRSRLGWRGLFAGRALREIRDHLEDAAMAHASDGTRDLDAQRQAVEQFGSPEATAQMVIGLDGGLRAMDWMTDRSTLKVLVPVAPSLILMSLGVLVYNADLAFLQSLNDPLHLLQWKYTWLRITLTIVLPAAAVLIAFGTSIRFEHPERDAGWQMSLVVPSPAHLFYRVGAACLVNIATFIYY